MAVSAIAFVALFTFNAGAQTTPQRPQQPETRAALQKQLEARFDALDANKDGVISPEERKAGMSARRAQMFARVDKDGNGAISRDEFDSMKPGRGAGRPGKGGPGKALAARGPETKAEFVSHRLAMFDRVDTNKDGVISDAERAAIRGKMRTQRGANEMPPPPPGG
jgi:hypothetical protein